MYLSRSRQSILLKFRSSVADNNLAGPSRHHLHRSQTKTPPFESIQHHGAFHPPYPYLPSNTHILISSLRGVRQYGDIEDLVLSGRLFAPPSRSSSPVRPPSPSSLPQSGEPWHPEADDFAYDSDAERRAEIEAHVVGAQPPGDGQQQQQRSIGMGPGRTGVKGVIRDRREAEAAARARRAEEVREINRAMEKASLGGKTWAEEERERRAAEARAEGTGTSRGARSGGRYGHLREVGVRSYVQAVEEDRNVWVVVHIYDPVRGSVGTRSLTFPFFPPIHIHCIDLFHIHVAFSYNV